MVPIKMLSSIALERLLSVKVPVSLGASPAAIGPMSKLAAAHVGPNGKSVLTAPAGGARIPEHERQTKSRAEGPVFAVGSISERRWL